MANMLSIMFGGMSDDGDDNNGVTQPDFRNVPSSDKGNEDYSDKGMLGRYTVPQRVFEKDPVGLKRYAGYGATEADLRLGYIEPTIREDPAYDKPNYEDRSTDPSKPDELFNNSGVMPDDWEFRRRKRVSRGFLTRPTNSTER